MLHGSTRFVVRAVALLSAQKREISVRLYILYQFWRLYKPVVRYSTLTSSLPESAESGVGLTNGKTTTLEGDGSSRKGEVPIPRNERARARGTAESMHD